MAAEDSLIDKKYNTFEKIHTSGEHIEHLHAFVRPSLTIQDVNDRTADNSQRIYVGDIGSTQLTMPMHTDSGLFIAMTAGFHVDPNGDRLPYENGLFMLLPTGSIVKVVTDTDALIFMMGQGAENWLNPKLGRPLRAVPHAVIADASTSTRAWFGKMYLPPIDAKAPFWNGRTYGEYRDETREASVRAIQNNERFVSTLPAACGDAVPMKSRPPQASVMHENVYTTHFKSMVTNTLCSDGNGVMCWQTVRHDTCVYWLVCLT